MSGQYPSGYNSPLGGHRGQFNPQQQQQSPQIMNTMNQMGGGGMGQNSMVGGGAGGQVGVGSSGMMPIGSYHGQQQQLPSGMGMGGPGSLMNTTMNIQQQQQMQHAQMVQGGGGGGGSGPVGAGMMSVGGPGMGGGPTGNIMLHSQQQQMAMGAQQQQQQQPQQQQQVQIPQPNTGGIMHSQQGTPQTSTATTTSSSMLAISQPNPHKEINIVALSRLGQETVQDITSRFQEIFTALKIIQPTANRDNNTEKKVQEYFRTIRLLFKRVRIIYEKCNDGYPHGMDYTNVESLITYKEEQPDHRNEPTQCDEYRKALQENQELIETVRLKNRQLREIIDRTRIIIWEINTMLAMRRS